MQSQYYVRPLLASLPDDAGVELWKAWLWMTERCSKNRDYVHYICISIYSIIVIYVCIYIYLEYSEILFLKIAVAFGWSKILRVVGDLFWGDVSVPSFSSNAKPNHSGHAELCGTTLCLVDCGNKLGCAGHGSNCFLKSYGALVWRFTKNGKNTQKQQHPTTKKDKLESQVP